MNKVIALTGTFALLSSAGVFGQDAMKYGVKQLKVLLHVAFRSATQDSTTLSAPGAMRLVRTRPRRLISNR
jgi:hypothetical protein